MPATSPRRAARAEIVAERPRWSFPAALTREHARMADFVAPDEGPTPSPGHPVYRTLSDVVRWREMRALRLWQQAVTGWGDKHGLTSRDLRRLGVWPTRPPHVTGHTGGSRPA